MKYYHSASILYILFHIGTDSMLKPVFFITDLLYRKFQKDIPGMVFLNIGFWSPIFYSIVFSCSWHVVDLKSVTYKLLHHPKMAFVHDMKEN